MNDDVVMVYKLMEKVLHKEEGITTLLYEIEALSVKGLDPDDVLYDYTKNTTRRMLILNAITAMNYQMIINPPPHFFDIPYNKYLRTHQWRIKRRLAIEYNDNKCQMCGSYGSLGPGRYSSGFFDVHHNSYAHIGHEPIGDLVVLCSDCHADYHNKQRRYKRDIKYYAKAALSHMD